MEKTKTYCEESQLPTLYKNNAKLGA